MPRGFGRRTKADEDTMTTDSPTPVAPEPDVETGNGPAFPDADTDPASTVDDLPGMWERADFEGGYTEVVSDQDKIEGDLNAEREAEAGTSDNDEAEQVAQTGYEPEVVTELEPDVWLADTAPFGHQYDWDTATWTAPKGSGTKPCTCNKLVGHQCELTTKSRFATGHDARFKGILQKAFRAGKKLQIDLAPEDHATILNSEGVVEKLEGRYELEADQIARLLAPKLLPHVTHDTRAAKLRKADAEAGTTVPQTAVETKADDELTDADLAEQVDDAPADEFVEA